MEAHPGNVVGAVITGFCISVEAHPGNVVGYGVSQFSAEAKDLLAKMQSLVGGYIEAVPTSKAITIYCNEEGKNTGLPRNELAEQLWKRFDTHGCLDAGDWIAGNVVILGPATPSGRETSAPGNTVDLIVDMVSDAG